MLDLTDGGKQVPHWVVVHRVAPKTPDPKIDWARHVQGLRSAQIITFGDEALAITVWDSENYYVANRMRVSRNLAAIGEPEWVGPVSLAFARRTRLEWTKLFWDVFVHCVAALGMIVTVGVTGARLFSPPSVRILHDQTTANVAVDQESKLILSAANNGAADAQLELTGAELRNERGAAGRASIIDSTFAKLEVGTKQDVGVLVTPLQTGEVVLVLRGTSRSGWFAPTAQVEEKVLLDVWAPISANPPSLFITYAPDPVDPSFFTSASCKFSLRAGSAFPGGTQLAVELAKVGPVRIIAATGIRAEDAGQLQEYTHRAGAEAARLTWQTRPLAGTSIHSFEFHLSGPRRIRSEWEDVCKQAKVILPRP